MIVQSVSIATGPEHVWNALTDPRAGEKWRNADFKTDWRAGSPIKIEAVVGIKRYRAKGFVIQAEPPALLQYSYWSHISGLQDVPQSYSTITMRLEAQGSDTILTVEQQVPPSPERRGKGWTIGPESSWKHVEFYWRMTLPVLKRLVEQERSTTGDARVHGHLNR
jgi:uncharacterized protein YndB with AHSA1/START domain